MFENNNVLVNGPLDYSPYQFYSMPEQF